MGPPNCCFKDYLGTSNKIPLTWKPITEEEVIDVLCALDASKSHGYDNLSVRLIKGRSTFYCLSVDLYF